MDTICENCSETGELIEGDTTHCENCGECTDRWCDCRDSYLEGMWRE